MNYGRDSDSIATMAGAVTGGLGGLSAIPSQWITSIETNSRMDISASARSMADIARRVLTDDRDRLLRRLAALDSMLDSST